MVSNISTSSIALPDDLKIDGKEVTGTLDDALNTISDSIATASANINTLFAQVQDEASQSADLDQRIASIEAQTASSSAQLAETHGLAEDAFNGITALGERFSNWISSFSETPSKDIKLTPPETLIATGSATIANVEVKSDAKIAGELTANSATITDTFKAMGKTVLSSDVTIGGSLGMNGTLINGMLSIADNSINVIGAPTSATTVTDGVLYLQNSPLAGSVDILNGAIIVEKNGTMSVKGNINVGGNLNVDGAITITGKAGEDIKAGDALYISDSEVVKKADATDIQRLAVVGIAAKDAATGTKATIIIAGKVKGLTDLKVGKKYFLGTDGSIINVLPINAVKVVPIGIAFSNNELIVQIAPYPGADVSGVSTTATPEPSITGEGTLTPAPEPSTSEDSNGVSPTLPPTEVTPTPTTEVTPTPTP
jgi:hypothetical protein